MTSEHVEVAATDKIRPSRRWRTRCKGARVESGSSAYSALQ